MPATLSDVVVDVVAAADKLRADDRLITSSATMLDDLEAIFDAITTLKAAAVHRLREAANLDATTEQYGRSTRNWLVEDLRFAGPEASKLMRLVRELPARPLTEAAFDSAAISADHSIAILTALRSLPVELRETIEPHLVERARECPPEEIAGFVDQLLDSLGLDKPADVRRERRFADRGFDVGKGLDDSRLVSGRLTPEIGEQLEQAFARAAQPSGSEDDRTQSQRRHDALATILAAYLGQGETPSFNGAPRTVIVTIDLETLENQLREAWITLPSGATISAATARRLACDAELIPVVLGRGGEVLDIGQADHEFTAAIRRAAYVRDGGRCAFPDCSNRVTELHHIVFRRHSGPTSLDNAAWLCGYHHYLVHEAGWTLQRQQLDGSYLWTGPHGQQRIRHLSTAPPSAPLTPLP